MQNKKFTFDQLKQYLANKLANDDLTPSEARFYADMYGKRLSQSDPALFEKVARLAAIYGIIEPLKIKAKHSNFTAEDLNFTFEYFGSIIKRFEPELYDQLKSLEISPKLKQKG